MKSKFLIIIPLVLVVFFMLLPEPEEKLADKKSNQPSETTEGELKNNELISSHFVIRNVRVYDGFIRIEKADVLVQDNKIVSIAVADSSELISSKPTSLESVSSKSIASKPNLIEIDGTGKTLLPGLIDAHTHAYLDALTEALNFGVTTELDMFTMPEFANSHQGKREQIDSTNSADLFSATILATAPGGHGTQFGFDIPVLENSQQVDTFVKKRIEQGADYIKAVYNSNKATRHHFPSIDHATIAALIDSAHHHNRMLVVHVDNLVSAKEVIELGADGIIHSFMDKPVDEHFIQLMLDKQAFIVPTLAVQASVTQQPTAGKLLKRSHNLDFVSKTQHQQLKATFPNFGIPAQALSIAEQSVAALAKAGVAILAGSDAPNPGTSHGLSLHAELELLVKAGLSNEQALHAATGAVGKQFPIGLRGQLVKGQLATMILVEGNPFENISDTQKISRIWKNGIEFKRVKAGEGGENPVIVAGLINNFNQQIEATKLGTGISQSTDQLAGGKSSVELSLVNDPQLANNQYLKVSGEVSSGFMFPWSGFSYLLGATQQSGADLSKVKSLKFRAKGDSQTNKLSVLIFQTGSLRPIQKDLELSESWQDFELVLSEVKSLDTTDIANISVVRAQSIGPFEFMIDDLRFE